jgi:hypothetical protein
MEMKVLIDKIDMKVPFKDQLVDILKDKMMKKSQELPAPFINQYAGFHAHKDANEIANSIRVPSLTREFLAVSSDRRDEVWKSVSFMSKHPLLINDGLFSSSYYTHFFDFETINHLVQLERQGVNQVVSKGIPGMLNKAIEELRVGLHKKAKGYVNEEKRVQNALALARTLALAAQLKDFIAKIDTQDGPKIDLSQYGVKLKEDEAPLDYRNLFLKELGSGIEPEMTKVLRDDKLPRLFLESLTLENVLDPSLKEAIIFFQAALDVRWETSSDSVVNTAIRNLVDLNLKAYRDSYLEMYFIRQRFSVKPKGLAFDAAGTSLQYKNKAPQPVNDLAYLNWVLEDLGFKTENEEWYLGDGQLMEQAKALLGKPLTAFAIEEDVDTERYQIQGTNYSFDRNGKIYFELDGMSLVYMRNRNEIPYLEPFGIQREFDPKQDRYFESDAGRKWVIRDGEPRYFIDNQLGKNFVMRTKDNAVIVENVNEKGIWRANAGPGLTAGDTYTAYSVQEGAPPGEYRYVNVKGEMLLESVAHPGFYVSKNPASCKKVDLTKAFGLDNFKVLQNSEKEQILICTLEDREPREWIEFTIANDRIHTEDPWDLDPPAALQE